MLYGGMTCNKSSYCWNDGIIAVLVKRRFISIPNTEGANISFDINLTVYISLYCTLRNSHRFKSTYQCGAKAKDAMEKKSNSEAVLCYAKLKW